MLNVGAHLKQPLSAICPYTILKLKNAHSHTVAVLRGAPWDAAQLLRKQSGASRRATQRFVSGR
jgi:hypothetical protein